MDRRLFITMVRGSILAAPLAAEAQQVAKMWRIGWLGDGTRAAREWNTLTPLREGLRELCYTEVKNLKTAKALGLTIPQTLLLRADEIVQ